MHFTEGRLSKREKENGFVVDWMLWFRDKIYDIFSSSNSALAEKYEKIIENRQRQQLNCLQ